jgi:hypothetical protein
MESRLATAAAIAAVDAIVRFSALFNISLKPNQIQDIAPCTHDP